MQNQLINTILAANIRRLRESQGLSLTDACKVSGLTRRQWCDLEAGHDNPELCRGNPTLRILSVVAYSLNTDVLTLLKPYTNDETY